MKLTPVFLLIIVLTGCQSATERKENPIAEKIMEPKEIKNGDFASIGENLFKDKEGNIYFRTIDRSTLNEKREVYATYSNMLYYDTILANGNTFAELELKNIVDPTSFKRTGKEGLTTYYKDKNHTYFHREMAYGGTLHCNR